MRHPHATRIAEALPRCAVALAALALFIHLLRMPLVGDDLHYSSPDPAFADASLLTFMSGVWHHCNARFGDLTNHLWLCMMPRPATALLCALMLVLMFVALRGLCGFTRREGAAWGICVAAAFTVCPWWDEFNLFVVQFNYTWAIALAALSMWLIFSRQMRGPLWLCYLPVAFISGFGHEIIGLPMLAGMSAWLIFSRPGPLTIYKKWVIAALFAGCLFSMSSPASYARLMNPADSYLEHVPVWRLILSGGYMAPAVAADAAALLLWRRRDFKRLCCSSWLPLAVVTLTSLVFVVAGNVEGRAGWAVQFFGVAAFGRQWALLHRHSSATRTGIILSGTLSALVCAQWCGAIWWQWKVDDDTARCISVFKAAPQQPVSAEIHTDADIPLWLGGKVRGVPFSRDRWAGDAFSQTDGHPLILAPQEP